MKFWVKVQDAADPKVTMALQLYTLPLKLCLQTRDAVCTSTVCSCKELPPTAKFSGENLDSNEIGFDKWLEAIEE